MRKFVSKRNNVYFKENFVFKEHKNNEAAEQEAEFLKLLNNKAVAVPKVISVNGSTLCMEYIEGDPLPDFMLTRDNSTRCSEVAESISKWLESFYTAVDYQTTSEIRGDVNGRNFLVTADGIAGVDFEEHIFGRKETDFGRLLAYVATYSYDDTYVQRVMEEKLIKSFTKRFSINECILLEEKTKELKVLERFRRIKN